MKKIKVVFMTLFIGLFLVACGSNEKKADFTTKEAETALNNGEDINGKTVEITVDEYVPNGALGTQFKLVSISILYLLIIQMSKKEILL